jgi:hypothetical protein
MHRSLGRSIWTLSLLITGMMSSGAGAAPQNKPAEVEALCTKHEAGILRLVDDGKFVEALLASIEYEQALRGCYPAASIADGTFHSDNYLLDFKVPFAKAWRPAPPNAFENAAAYRAAGMEWIAALDGPTEAEHIAILSMDMGTLMRRMGLSDISKVMNPLVQARQIASNMGKIVSERVDEGTGGMAVVRMTLSAGRTIELATIPRDDRTFIFVATAAEGQAAENTRRMDQWVGALKFRDPDPAKTARVAAVRAKLPKNADAKAVLPVVRELAALGEYRDAALLMADLRTVLVASLPQPHIDAKGMTFASYGVTLGNPDAERWRAQDMPVGNMHMLVLQDRASVTEGFAGVMVMDPILLFGLDAFKLIGSNNIESDESRVMLSAMGRGSLLNVGTKIEVERFRKFQGRVAYEGIVEAAKMQNTKVKCILVRGSRALYMVMLLGAPEILAEYEKVIDANLRIVDAASGATTRVTTTTEVTTRPATVKSGR